MMMAMRRVTLNHLKKGLHMEPRHRFAVKMESLVRLAKGRSILNVKVGVAVEVEGVVGMEDAVEGVVLVLVTVAIVVADVLMVESMVFQLKELEKVSVIAMTMNTMMIMTEMIMMMIISCNGIK